MFLKSEIIEIYYMADIFYKKLALKYDKFLKNIKKGTWCIREIYKSGSF